MKKVRKKKSAKVKNEKICCFFFRCFVVYSKVNFERFFKTQNSPNPFGHRRFFPTKSPRQNSPHPFGHRRFFVLEPKIAVLQTPKIAVFTHPEIAVVTHPKIAVFTPLILPFSYCPLLVHCRESGSGQGPKGGQ